MESKGKGKINPERQRLRYSAEFKREAVRLLELGQKPGTTTGAGTWGWIK